MEVRAEMKPYKGVINTIILNYWLEKLKIYFCVHNVWEEQKITFLKLEVEGHVKIWFESHIQAHRLGRDVFITKWEVIKDLNKS